MATVDLEVPRRALAIGAHPDDIEFGCGGTLAKWAVRGCAIALVVCTDGSKGTWDASTNIAELIEVRIEEQQRAASQLSQAAEVIHLGWTDGELEYGIAQRRQLAYWIRHFRPDVVLGHDPWKRYRIHPDHRSAGFLTTDGIVAARDPQFFRDLGLAPHRPQTLLLFEPEEIDHVEDVSATLRAKIDALLEHRSQFRSTMHIDFEGNDSEEASLELERFAQRIHAELKQNGIGHDVAYAEVFKRIDCL